MSIETWKSEFYPVSAEDCPEGEELQHALLKWTGLSGSNLEKHGLIAHHGYICEIADITISMCPDDRHCALCIVYDSCLACPLKTCQNSWTGWIYSGNHKQMLNLIKKATEKCITQNTQSQP